MIEQLVEAPSIGRIGEPYYDEKNDRVKYFSTSIFEDRNSIDDEIVRATQIAEDNQASRITMRFITPTGVYMGNEANIALGNGFTGFSLLYYGENNGSRVPDESETMAEDVIIQDIHTKQRNSEKRCPGRYAIVKLEPGNVSEQDIMGLEKLFAEAFTTYTTTLDQESIREMIANNVAYAARDQDGRIVSIAVAERAEFDVEERTFSVAELSEYATKKEHRSQGLAQETTRALLNELMGNTEIIYAESRASHYAVNKVFYNLGFDYRGRLAKHCVLSGDQEVDEQGPYENLNVWSMIGMED